MTKLSFCCLVMTIKRDHSYFKCFSPANTVRPLQIIVDSLKKYGTTSGSTPYWNNQSSVKWRYSRRSRWYNCTTFAKMEVIWDDNQSDYDHLLTKMHLWRSLLQIWKLHFVFMGLMQRANGKSICGKDH